jgi:cell division protein FtsB
LANLSSLFRSRWRLTWRLFCGGIGIALGLVVYVRWLVTPWTQGVKTSVQVRQKEAQLRNKRVENARLAQHLTYLNSPEGIESLARSRGYHQVNEHVYLEPRH